MTLPIPTWNQHGLLPPVFPGESATSIKRAPYRVSFLDFVMQFSQTPERQTILEGFLNFRSALHAAGLTEGFQWINGSFMENVETLHDRSPNDIDVVTFFELSNDKTEESLEKNFPHLFDYEQVKQTFLTDSYFIFLGAGYPEPWIIKNSTYWYSVWAHQRSSFSWKGFLEVDLAPTFEEESRRVLLCEKMKGGLQ